MSENEIKNAHLVVDVVMFAMRAGELHVLMVERAWEPFAGFAALPGGYVNEGEEPDEAARREAEEETGVTELDGLRHFGTYAAVGRDPRARVVSLAHVVLLRSMPEPVAGSDARTAQWRPVREVLKRRLAFDHVKVLRDALAVVQGS